MSSCPRTAHAVSAAAIGERHVSRENSAVGMWRSTCRSIPYGTAVDSSATASPTPSTTGESRAVPAVATPTVWLTLEINALEEAEIEAALTDAPPGDPLGRFRCLGIAYLRWAMKNPTHFEIISSRRFFDHDRSAGVSSDNAELIGLTERMLAEASAAGQLRALDLKQVQIAGRALVYGFARMHIDGHLPRWGVGEAEAGRMAADILDLFIAGITAPAAAEAKV